MTSGLIWITGLSGAGKTTLAEQVVQELRARGVNPVVLDGDRLREKLGPGYSGPDQMSYEARLALAMRYAEMCAEQVALGQVVVIATISMFHRVRDWNRANIKGYFEVYLRVPLSELRRRDPKGIYERFDQGKLSNVAGLDLKVEEPKTPDLVFDFDPNRTVQQMAVSVVEGFLERK